MATVTANTLAFINFGIRFPGVFHHGNGLYGACLVTGCAGNTFFLQDPWFPSEAVLENRLERFLPPGKMVNNSGTFRNSWGEFKTGNFQF